jgi:hypothetical protein
MQAGGYFNPLATYARKRPAMPTEKKGGTKSSLYVLRIKYLLRLSGIKN